MNFILRSLSILAFQSILNRSVIGQREKEIEVVERERESECLTLNGYFLSNKLYSSHAAIELGYLDLTEPGIRTG